MFPPGKRRRLNFFGICVCTFLPWFIFLGVYGALCFDLHYNYPALAWFIVAVGGIISVGAAASALNEQKQERDPQWWFFGAVACSIAVVSASICGDLNFRWNLSRYYDINNLQVYEDVKPSLDRGQGLMDAGKVYFAAGTVLDATRSVGFMNGDLFCVAPIIDSSATMTNYDFWAVGKNCCADRADFRCGEYANPRARNGLRLMIDEDRPFYRLAVQEAEAVFNMSSRHPLFFYWMQDPLGAQNAYRDDGYKYFLIGVFTHFGFNLLCVLGATMGFAKLGSRHYA